MRFNRDRYVTICQQFLVTASVVAVGMSAAGVMTLQIVTPDSDGPDASSLAPAVRVGDAFVSEAPVTPQVREVKVAPVKQVSAEPQVAAARQAPQAEAQAQAQAQAPVTKAPAKPAAEKSATEKPAAEKSATEKPAAEKPAAPANQARVLAAVSQPTAVKGFATVGVTWKAGTELSEDQIKVEVRTQKDGVWSGWTTAAYHDEHGPDAGTAEDKKIRPGTDALVVGNVDEVQMRAETADGRAPEDLELAIVDPGEGRVTKAPPAIDTAKLPATDRDATSSAPIESTAGMDGSGSAAAEGTQSPGDGAAADLDLVAMKTAPKPLIYSRAQWGANEALRDKSSLRYGSVKAGFIHHTVNANNYTPEQVPALLRGIYAYHTQSRGWSDIGYNYLVDRFGRIWEGRYGGVDRAVVGAHTSGYNDYAFAMSAIGNFDIAQPPQAVLDAYAMLFAWKLSLYDIRADATRVYVKDRYLQAINGHRDVGQTACPGRYLYAQIPAIRAAAQAIQNRAQVPADPVVLPPVAVPPGTPAPTTAPRVAAPQPGVAFPARVSVAGDGWPDLITKTADGLIQVVPTSGVLDYTGRIVSGGNWSAMGALAVVGDVTGDGISDLWGKNARTGQARIFPGDGTGRFRRTGIAPTVAFAGVGQVFSVGDFNGDRRNDLAGVSRSTGALLLFKGKGKGAFANPVVLRKKWPFTRAVGVGRFNNDARPDIVGVSGGRALYLLKGVAGRKLAAPVRIGTLPGSANALFGWGDLNGDGKADLMARVAGSGLSYLYAGTGAGRLGQVYGPFAGLTGLNLSSAAPVAGTVAADVVGRDAAGRLVTVTNNGLGTLGAPLPTNLRVTGATQVLSAGDWDRNGTGDVIVRTDGGNQLLLYPGLGNGRFGQARSLGVGWQPFTSLAAVGDVTGDGYPDLMGKQANGPMTVFPGAGLQAVGAPELAPASMRTFNQIGAAAWASTGAVLASQNGSFVPLAGSGSGLAGASYDSFVGAGDVNGDGVADLLAREVGTGVIWLLPGKTSGGFAPRVWVANGFAGYQLIG